MWIFLPDAMLSIVAHRTKPRVLLVRARLPGDIERVFPGAKVKRTPRADYRYRAEVTRLDVDERLSEHIHSMAYTNVKAAIPAGERCRHDAMHDVWGVMYRAQQLTEARATQAGEREAPHLHTGDTFRHVTSERKPRTVYVHLVQDRTLGEPDVTLEYRESGKVTTVRYSVARHWLRNAERIA